MTHICVGKFTIIGSDNGLSPSRRQAIIWTNAGILLIRPSGANFREILIEINTFSFTKMHLKMSSGKWRPFCLGLNELIVRWISDYIHYKVRRNYSSFPKLQRYIRWSLGVISNFISQLTGHVITYSWLDLGYSMLVKGPQVTRY